MSIEIPPTVSDVDLDAIAALVVVFLVLSAIAGFVVVLAK